MSEAEQYEKFAAQARQEAEFANARARELEAKVNDAQAKLDELEPMSTGVQSPVVPVKPIEQSFKIL